MRISCSFIVAGTLLLPLQAMAQSGSVGGSGTGSAGVTTGTAPSTTGSPNAPSSATTPNPPGTNSLGTAQSSGGVTTGSSSGSTPEDKKIQDENRDIDRKLKGLRRGCCYPTLHAL